MQGTPSYEAALELLELLSGVPANAHWRALLKIATASSDTWAIFEPYLQLDSRRVDLESLTLLRPVLGANEDHLVNLAIHLFLGYGSVDMAALAEGLDGRYWLAALEALEEYRAGFVGD